MEKHTVTRWDHYQRIRHSQPDLYWNSKTQTQMLQNKSKWVTHSKQYEMNLETEDGGRYNTQEALTSQG